MFSRDATTVIAYRNFRFFRIGREGENYFAALGGEADGVIDQVTDGASKKNGIGIDLTLTETTNGQVSLIGDHFIVGSDLFERGPAIEEGSVDGAFGRFGAREKKEIIDDCGKPRALRNVRFDHGLI